MGRALLTPDELRRLDNDICIIFEKGIKPIKANKYYYFKYPESKIVNRYKADHNDVHIERGVWRKYNPYQPYEEGQDANAGKAQSLESLNDLFEDIENKSPNASNSGKASTSNAGTAQAVATKTEEEARQEELVDIQKELEAKFDELFGSIDE